MDERVGGAHEDGESLTVLGRLLEAGESAPTFTLDHLSGTSMTTIRLADLAGSVVVLNVVNSVDTEVCDRQTCRVDSLFPGATILTVSMDLPFALARWTAAAGVTHAAVSSHRSETFGQDYGVLIKEWRALQRSLFVIDGAGRLIHTQYVVDQTQEPDYDAAVAAAAKALSA